MKIAIATLLLLSPTLVACGGPFIPFLDPGVGGGGGSSFGSSNVSVVGSLHTSMMDIPFTSVDSEVAHKLDIDPVEDGCIAENTLTFRVSSTGCTLKLEFGAVTPTAGGLKAVTFTADSFCPGFLDAKEGVYKSVPGYGPWWAGPINVNQREASTASLPGTRITFPDKPIQLEREDGLPLTINLKDLVVSGTLVSRGDTALHCFTPSCGSRHVVGADGWCVARSLASVNSGTSLTLNDIWGSGANDAWAVGDLGTVLHWNGSAWAKSANGTSSELIGVWGSGPGDVWAVGVGAILHWNGSAWATVPNGPGGILTGVWGSGPNDVWAVGYAGTILHWNGTAWTKAASGTTKDLRAVWGSGPKAVWAVGDSGTVVQWNGTAWANIAGPSSQNLLGVWGSAPGDVWVAGGYGTILRWNGTSWSSLAGPPKSAAITSIWGTGPGDVWAALSSGGVVSWDGVGWQTEKDSGSLNKVWGSFATDVWAVGRAGTILRSHR